MNVIFRTQDTSHRRVRALHYPWCGYISSFHVAPLIPPPPGFEYSDKRNMSSHVLVPGAVSCRVEYMRREPFSLSLTHMKLSMDNLYWFPDSFLQNMLSSSTPGAVHFVELYQRKHCLIIVKLFYIFISTFNHV